MRPGGRTSAARLDMGITAVILPGDMKTAISIPDKVFDSADSLAKKMKLSRSQLYAKAIEEFVAEHARMSVREKLDQVYATEPSKLDPVVSDAQAAAIGREDW